MRELFNCGVYAFKSLASGKMYVGASVNLNKRRGTHFRMLETNRHHSRYFQSEFNEYGKDNFIYGVIEFCDRDNKKSKEQYYLDLYSPKLNVSLSSVAPMEGRKHSKETLEKFKLRPPSPGPVGHKQPLEQRLAQAERQRGTTRSIETKKKMSETAKRVNSIGRIDRDKTRKKIVDNYGTAYNSLTEASKKLGIPACTICDNLKGRSKLVRKKYSFKYLED